MELPELFLAGLVATATYTLGCLMVTWIRNSPSGEPKMLKKFLARLGVSEYETCEQSLAFTIRFSISLIFIFGFELLTETDKNNSILPTVMISVLSGILGIVAMRFFCNVFEEMMRIEWQTATAIFTTKPKKAKTF